ncbi:MAG: ISNCY family transposase [Longimicrobiales bacterium]
MSSKEFRRAVVLARVSAGEMTLRQATPLLGVSYRQAKRLYGRFRAGGRTELVHGNVGRRSHRARDEAEKARVLDLIGTHYSGPVERGPGQRFGPTLASEHLSTDHGITVPVSTLRDWMLAAGSWTPVRRRKPRPQRRERRAHFGELVQLDGSHHDWFEGRGERAGRRSCMMNMVDDATGKTGVRFGDGETIWAAVDVLQAWIARYGVPRALYTDWKNVYKREPTDREQREGVIAHTQFGRMCAKLGIEIIAASTPQAKGRVERSNGVQQDRLIKKMRLRGISDDEAANAYVENEYVPELSVRFAVQPASPVDYHMPRDPELADRDVFCLEHTRTVSNDFVVQFGRRSLQLNPSVRGRVAAGSKVVVRESREGEVRVIHVNRRGEEREYSWTPAMRPGAKVVAEASALPESAKPKARSKPAANHPFRRANKLGVARAAIARAER